MTLASVPTPNVAWVATKAPGGAYHKNLFHQLEHVYCFLRKAATSGRARAEGHTVAHWRGEGKAVPLGELVVEEQRARAPRRVRYACREGMNRAARQ